MPVSNRLRVDPIVLSVRTDESYIDNAIGIVDPHHDSVLVTRDVEHRSTVLQDTCVADIALNVCRSCPVELTHLLIPRESRLASVRVLWVAIEEPLKGSQSDDAHSVA